MRWTLSNALNVWARHSRLTFSEWDSDRADIIINFHRESHGDNFPFDGKGQVLAHAFFPGEGIGGDAHFDEDEVWLTTEPEQENRVGTNLFHVAAHEFGHSLGLQHSHEPQALMYPFYQHNIGNNLEQLPEDDRAGIQALYGAREDTDVWRRMPSVTTPRITTTTTHPTTTSPSPPPMPPRYPKPTYYPRHPTYHTPRRCDPRKPYSKHCKYPPKYPLPPPPPPPQPPPQQPQPRWTTTTPPPPPPVYTTTQRGLVYSTTSRRHVGRGGDSNSGRGRKDKVPDTCSTSYDAISVIRREVFIFKNQYFWRIGEQGLLRGYPVLIERMWHGLPTNLTHVDAVYERPDNRIVFFIGRRYYVFIGNQVDPRSAGGHPLTDLGLPADLPRIDAALVWGHNGRTFLFSGSLYWRLDEELQRVELDYPRSIEMWRGVGQSIDAAFQWKDGYTYFFRGKGFWRFNDLRMRVDHERQTLSAPFWMGCDVQRLQIADRSAYVNQILPHTAASGISRISRIEFITMLAIVLVYIYPG